MQPRSIRMASQAHCHVLPWIPQLSNQPWRAAPKEAGGSMSTRSICTPQQAYTKEVNAVLVWMAKQRCTRFDLSDVAALPLESRPSSASCTNSAASLTWLSHSCFELLLAPGD